MVSMYSRFNVKETPSYSITALSVATSINLAIVSLQTYVPAMPGQKELLLTLPLHEPTHASTRLGLP